MHFRRLLTPALGVLLALSAPLGAVAAHPSSSDRSDDELDRLLAPIALYPDALIGIILPAATKPVDIVMAIRYFQEGGSRSSIDRQPWDDTVRALAHHRDVLEYLNTELLWTRDLAEAFLAQPEDVMESIQRLRRRAFAAGTLRTTPEHRIILEDDTIRIVPADPEVIYVPRYDTREVYVERRYHDPYPLITFGLGFSTGSWLGYDCDWRHRRIYFADPAWSWHSHADWRWRRFHHGHRHESHFWTAWSPTRRHVRRPVPHHYSPPPAPPPVPRHAPAPDVRRRPDFDRPDSSRPYPRHAHTPEHDLTRPDRPDRHPAPRHAGRPTSTPPAHEPEQRPRRDLDRPAPPTPPPGHMGRERFGNRPAPVVQTSTPPPPPREVSRAPEPRTAPRFERPPSRAPEPRHEPHVDRDSPRSHPPEHAGRRDQRAHLN